MKIKLFVVGLSTGLPIGLEGIVFIEKRSGVVFKELI
jgi:hypothetical protein